MSRVGDVAVRRNLSRSGAGNATRIFWKGQSPEVADGWDIVARERIGAWAYALTGGYSKPQLYPASWYPMMRSVDRLAELVPGLTALRALVVLRRRD